VLPDNLNLMKRPKYSRLEFERRFLVRKDALPDLDSLDYVDILDRYLVDTRIRLRKVTNPISGEITYKLCKKYHSKSAFVGPIVNTYLDEAEYLAFINIPADTITKRRYRILYSGELFGLDIFLAELTGLNLCEIEQADMGELDQARVPAWVDSEVTDDPFFTGGNLCRVASVELLRKLESSFGDA